MTIGASRLLEEFGSPLAIAEALLIGKMDSHDQGYVSEIVTPIVMEAAKFRVEKHLAAGTIKLFDDKILPQLKPRRR